jgi:hypothetical protein
MSDQGEQQIADGRRRDQQRAQSLGGFTQIERPLDLAAEHADLWREMVEMVEMVERVAASGPDFLAVPARNLLARVRAL